MGKPLPMSPDNRYLCVPAEQVMPLLDQKPLTLTLSRKREREPFGAG